MSKNLDLVRSIYADCVGLGVACESGRLVGGEGRGEQRVAHVAAWTNGKIVRQTHYTDITEARAVAERLAEERG